MDQNFVNKDWIDVDLSGRSFTNCRFDHCNFSGSDLSGTEFDSCVFVDCNLSNPKINRTRARDVRFQQSKLVGLAFQNFDPFALAVHFEGCQIRLCSFSGLKLRQPLFRDCQIADSDFKSTSLVEADFSGSQFQDCLFHDAHLEQADFSTARGYSLDPRSSHLRGASFAYPEVLTLLAGFGVKVV